MERSEELGDKDLILLLTLKGKLLSLLPRLVCLSSLPPHTFQTSLGLSVKLYLSTLLSQKRSVAARDNAFRSRTESDSNAITSLPALLSDREESQAGVFDPSWTHSSAVGFS